MDILRQQIRRAQLRLLLQRFASRLSTCLFVSLLIAAAAVAVRKCCSLPIDGRLWSWSWIGGGAALGLLAAILWTYCQRQSALEAAIEIDRRFGLKERVSSSLVLTPTELETEAGQALVSDAMNRIDRLDVSQAFVVRPNRWSLLPLLPAAVAFALALLVGDKGSESTVAAKTTPEQAEQVKKSTQSLEKKLEERRREAHKQGLDDAADLFKKIEQGTKDLAEKSDLDRKQALVKLNDLAKEMEKRRDKLADDEKLKQQFKQLKDMQQGPADKVSKALKNGDFKEAVKQIDDLKQKLANGDLGEKEKEQLAKQIDQMRQTLEKQAEAREQAKQELQKQIDQARQAGRTDEAQKAQQQLDKLNQECEKCSKMSDLAKQLDQAAKGLKQGDAKAAQAALDKVSEQLQDMQQSSEEMAMLDQALDELAEAKNSMDCKNCNGQGCAQCQGKGQGQGQPKKQGPPGNGLGKGRGQGDRPEHENKTSFYDSNVRQNVGKGGAVVTDQVEGPNRKGEVREEIKSSFESSKHEAADPLTGQRLPREYREHAKTYFDAIREGQK